MKRQIIFSILLLANLFVAAQAKIEFIKTTHNYDTIIQGSDGRCTFTFLNNGNEPLVISSVSTSCGCTIPEFDKKPVFPGKTGHIRVSYNTELLGKFKKTIVVKSNAGNENTSILSIRGFVKKKEKKTERKSVHGG